MMSYLHTKFHDNWISSFRGVAMTRFWDGRTDRGTDGVTALLDLLSPSATQVKTNTFTIGNGALYQPPTDPRKTPEDTHTISVFNKIKTSCLLPKSTQFVYLLAMATSKHSKTAWFTESQTPRKTEITNYTVLQFL